MDTDEEMEDAGLARSRFLRATIAGGELTLNPPLGGTIRGGPASMTFARLDGIVLVDLRHAGEDDEELVATTPPNAPPIGRAARRVLTDWAALVGYRRGWLPDAVVDLEPPPPIGTASVQCPTCASAWSDGSEGFWATVRRNGHFPGYCPACGGSLPEWKPAAAARRSPPSAGGAGAARRAARRSRGRPPVRPRPRPPPCEAGHGGEGGAGRASLASAAAPVPCGRCRRSRSTAPPPPGSPGC